MSALSPIRISQPVDEPVVVTASAEPMRRIFESQRATALRWRQSTAEERIARIRKLRDAVQAAADDIRRAAAEDFRKPEVEVNLTELFTVISEANMAMRKLKRWMNPTRAGFTPLMAGTQGRIEYQPRGRCLIISPWFCMTADRFGVISDGFRMAVFPAASASTSGQNVRLTG